MVKLLIFDVDGVLENEEKISKERHDALFKAISDKFDISIEEAEKKYKETKEKLSSKLKQTSAHILMQLGFTREEYFKIIDSVDPLGIIKVNPNCLEMLEKLKDNKIVTYSNTPRKAIKSTLKILKIDKFIDKTYSSEDFDESKPSINSVKKILVEMGFKAEDTVAIGNSLEKDIVPPHELGIKTILFDQERKYSNPKEADFVITDLIEIVDIV